MGVSFLFCHHGRAKSNFSGVHGELSVLCFHSTVLDAQSGQEEEAGECDTPKYIFHGICGTVVDYACTFFELKLAEQFPRPYSLI